MPKLTPKLKQLLLRFLIYCGLFIFASGIIGSWVISTRLLYSFDFFFYGNLGKMFLISAIIFSLLIRHKIHELETLPKIKLNIFFFFFSLILIPVFFILGTNLMQFNSPSSAISLTLITHIVLISIPIFLLIGIFGIRFLTAFIKIFFKELLLCFCISLIYVFLIFQVWKLWPYFSDGVIKSVRFLLSLSNADVLYIQPRTLIIENFGVNIEKACSGLDSLFLFSSLYLLIAILDFKKFNKFKLFIMIIPAAIGLYLVNIFRVYILIIIGAYFSPDLSIRLFHTYLGMIFFILYFFIFWKLFYKWMMK